MDTCNENKEQHKAYKCAAQECCKIFPTLLNGFEIR